MAHAYLDETMSALRAGDLHELTGEEATHAVKVARLRQGEQVTLGNGAGLQVGVEVVSADRERLVVRALRDATIVPEPSSRILLVQALAKGGRDEQAVQAAVELGVSEIVPWQARRSIVKWYGAKATKQQARWQTIVREASKQAIRAFVPSVAPLATSTEVARLTADRTVFVLDPTSAESIAHVDLPEDSDIALVVGPEGGIAAEELALFEEAGARRVSLGVNIMRTSTAGPSAIAVLRTRADSWSDPR